jgi:uncharacterized protein (TIGR00369 family)
MPATLPPDPHDNKGSDDMLRTARKFMEALPHAKALNISLESIGDGKAEFAMPYDPQLVGDPQTGVLHGGAVSALLDSTCGAAVIAHPQSAGGTATLDLRIDYMRAATPGQGLVARAHCYQVTRSVAFVRAEALDDDRERPVATATGAFTFTVKS